jgi:hypothetical protein
MSFRHFLIISVFTISISPLAMAQTPVANRVNAMAEHLPKTASVIAKYTDNRRHCLYYSMHNRIFRYDVLSNKSIDVNVSSDGYVSILSYFLSPDGNFIFVVVDRGNLSSFYADDGQELWRLDSRSRQTDKIGSGFKIEKRRECIVIKKVFACTNPKASVSKQNWLAKNHLYDLYGHIIYAQDAYKINIKKIRK